MDLVDFDRYNDLKARSFNLVGNMTKKTKSKPDIEVHKKIHERVTKQKLQKIVKRVIELMSDNHTTMEICRILQPELGKSETQCKAYVKKAVDLLQIHDKEEASIKRTEMELSLRKDLALAYEQFNRLDDDNRNKMVWYKLILETKDRLARFLPEPEKQEDKQSISITYTSPGKRVK